ncbi:MAG: rod-binding protein [Proteobacteria bacterium]|nr:rod-binding protein [Pseudomonadota bacterium]
MKIPSNSPYFNQVEAPKKEEHPEIRKVAKQFEGLFLNQVVSAMRKTVVKGGMVPESNAERIYQSMLDSEYTEKMTDTQQLGLSQMIYEQLLRSSGAR